MLPQITHPVPDPDTSVMDGLGLPTERELAARHPVLVDVDDVRIGPGIGPDVRIGGIDAEHVEALARHAEPLPPVVLQRTTMAVVDGVHRVLAARLRGRTRIEAVFVDGGPEEVFLLAVRLNTRTGLPLTREDRQAAVVRVLARHPDWSDRRIAALAGVSPKTVGSARRRSTGEFPQSDSRQGQDGRARPVDAEEGRRRAAHELRLAPDAPVRQVAAVAGIAASTVSDVRRRLRAGLDPVPPAAAARPTTPVPPMAAAPLVLDALGADPSIRSTLNGRVLLRLLRAQVEGFLQPEQLLLAVPAHQAEAVARTARACAESWRRLADDVERQHAVTRLPHADALAVTVADRTGTRRA